MADFPLSYSEVTLNQRFTVRWKEITLNTGATQSTLQDIKLPENAGGYAYKDSGKSGTVTRNRFIYWRIYHDVLELVEMSLDFNLNGNHVKFKFQDTPFLEGLGIFETHSNVVILVATVSSVHRLLFPHPNKLQGFEPSLLQSSVQSLISIFADASVALVREPSSYYLICQNTTPIPQVHTSATWLTSEGDALFALATNSGSIIFIKLPPHGIPGTVVTHELRQSSVIQRLWTGLVPFLTRGVQCSGDASLSLCFHPIDHELLIFSLCHDHKIRMWSTKNLECVMVGDVLEHLSENVNLAKLSKGVVRHKLRKTQDSNGRIYLGAFLSFPEKRMFCVYNPVLISGHYHLIHVTTVHTPKSDLIDFTMTPSHIWTLWTNSENISTMAFSSIDYDGHTEPWNRVFLDPGKDKELSILEDYCDPREAYMHHIFYPGRLSIDAISKAVNIYRRSANTSFITDSNIPISVLKEEVSAVVENEIQFKASEYELSDDQYVQLQIECWGKFYSCCMQYHQVGTKPMGFFVDQHTGIVYLIKKNVFSVLKPSDIIEHLYWSPGQSCHYEDFTNTLILNEDLAVCQDLIFLFDCLKIVRNWIGSDVKEDFDHDLFNLETPEAISEAIVSNILCESEVKTKTPSIIPTLEKQLQCISNHVGAVDMLLAIIDLAQGQPNGLLMGDAALDASKQLSCSHLFASNIGLHILAKSLHDTAKLRYSLCRDLIILEIFVIRLGVQAGSSAEMIHTLQQEHLYQMSTLCRAYFILLWATQNWATQIHSNTIETGMRQLAALDLSESLDILPSHIYESHQNLTLAELFLRGIGGRQTRILLAQNKFLDEDPMFSNSALVPAVTIFAQLIWPISVSFLFPEFLMAKCQYIQLQEYIRLVHPWCEWSPYSRLFLLGHCYLNTGEPYKALEVFQEAAQGAAKEEFFVSKLVQTDEEESKKIEILYYLKVIRLLEQFSLPHLIINIATTAISSSDLGDSNIPTLWSLIFKYHLELEHYNQAYTAMISNPDPSRRKDCLRQFVVVLCERSQLKTLVEFPYIDLHDEIVSIIESRARSVDLTTHNYYELLYAFHIYRANYRKAGSVMYELGLRLGQEVPGLKGHQSQAKSYLAALNALRLVDPNNAWIIKPVPIIKEKIELDVPGLSPKRSYDGEELPIHTVKKQIEVFEMADIERDYLLVHARLLLYQRDPDPSYLSGPDLSPNETVSFLINAQLFDSALAISIAFSFSLVPIFEGLVNRCVKLMRGGILPLLQGVPELNYDSKDWFNNTMKTSCLSKEFSLIDQSWNLLQYYIDKFDQVSDYIYHKCVAVKLLSLGVDLPHWLVASYKKKNPAELLRLYLDFDLLEEASYFTLEYINAVLGSGAEYFGLTTTLHTTTAPVWLPYTAVDNLLHILKESQNEYPYSQLYKELSEKITSYQKNVCQVSQNVIDSEAQRKVNHPN